MLPTLLIALCLAAVHLFAGKLRFLDVIPRSRWLSMAGGVSVAYVFVHVLPDLSHARTTVERTIQRTALPPEGLVYLTALVGMTVFYGLERLAKTSRRANREREGQDRTTKGVFWVHSISFAVYNALIGYLLLHREVPGLRSLILFGLAMALHFLITDYGLRQDHKELYHNLGRWFLAAAVLLGWGVGRAAAIHAGGLALLFAFLAGGVVLNVLKEELPEERQSRFWAFALGAAGYAAVLLLL